MQVDATTRQHKIPHIVLGTLYPFDVLSDFDGKATIAEIYEEKDVARSLRFMFPEFDYSDFASMTVDAVSRKARREIVTGSISSDKPFIVELAIGQRAYVTSLEEAASVCRKYINDKDVKESAWRGGNVRHQNSISQVLAVITFQGGIEIPHFDVHFKD